MGTYILYTCLGVELPPLPVSEEEVLADVSLQHSNGQSVSEMEENFKNILEYNILLYFLLLPWLHA